jgi:hypothetical protein
MNDNNTTFSPNRYVERSLKYWWFIVLLSLLGAIAGFLFHLIQPPLYEARAMITVGIDFARTGYLTDIEEDQMIGLVGDVISSTDVIQMVQEDAVENGIIPEGQLVEDYLKLERWGFQWAARAANPNPGLAANLSNLWAEKAMYVLEESNNHAIVAEGLDRYIVSLENCLQTLVTLNPVHGQCPYQNLEDLQEELNKTVKALHREKISSKGISPSVQLVLSEKARVPDKPVRFGRNLLVFSGTMLGFLMGILLVEVNIPGKFFKGD